MRLESAYRLVTDSHLDALLIDHPSDVFYLTGQWFSAATLLLTADRASLLVDGRYFEQAKANVLCDVVLAEKQSLKKMLEGKTRIGFDSAFVTVEKSLSWQTNIPAKKWIPIAHPLKEMRVCKDQKEIAILKEAARLTGDGYRYLLSRLQEGVIEQELALDFEILCRKKGALKCSFDPIVAFGANSAFPHHRAGSSPLNKNQIVLFDLGLKVKDYASDMTRVSFFGEPDPELDRMYQLVREAHNLAAGAVCPGTRIGKLDEIVRSFFAEEGVEELFSHSLGHGVGIDVHEYPRIRFDHEDRDLILRPGMVFTIEPGLYLPGIGGVRYENTFIVTDSGSENLYGNL